MVMYKHDLFCDFLICLCITRADGMDLELNEDMVGWEPFYNVLPQILDGCSTGPLLLGQIATFPALDQLYTRTAILR